MLALIGWPLLAIAVFYGVRAASVDRELQRHRAPTSTKWAFVLYPIRMQRRNYMPEAGHRRCLLERMGAHGCSRSSRWPTSGFRQPVIPRKSARGLTFAAVDIQLLMLWSPLRASAPVDTPRRLWSAAERD
jgi:hypothetical protein